MAKNKSLENPVIIEKKIAKQVIPEESEGSTDSEKATEEEVKSVCKKMKNKEVVEKEKPKPKRQLSEKQKAAFEKARKVLAEKNAIRKAEKEKEK